MSLQSTSISDDDWNYDSSDEDLRSDSDHSSAGRHDRRRASAKKNELGEDGKYMPGQEDDTPKEILRRSIVDLGPNRLDMLGAVEVAVVLEELSDKLDIISISIDTPPIDIRREKSVLSGTTLHRPAMHFPPVLDVRKNEFSKEKWILTQHYSSVIPRRFQLQLDPPGLENITNIRKDPTYLLRLHGIKKFTEKGKIQADRTQAHVAIDIAVAELIQSCTFQTLIEAVDREESVIQEMTNMVLTSIDNAQRIVQLKKDKKQVRLDKVTESTAMDQAIYMLRDGTQEMMKRKELESAYIKKSGAMMMKRSQKLCDKSEREVVTELEDTRISLMEEVRSHESMDEVIKAKLSDAEDRLDYWMEKYEVDKETLQNELDTMKANRERDLKRIVWLKNKIHDYLQICRDERRIKNKLAEEERLHRLKDKRIVKIQAWWRGQLVRHRLGPFRPEKQGKESDKKGKNEKKGKK